MQCQSCKTELKLRLNFCPHCGIKLDEKPCAKCNTMLRPDWEYCPKCGASSTGKQVTKKALVVKKCNKGKTPNFQASGLNDTKEKICMTCNNKTGSFCLLHHSLIREYDQCRRWTDKTYLW
ncbi:MAG: hypothetical protein Ta2F_17610 [Termitinemataceae bacterium]|nr:MAG: hypothetical protein Ta2F_17610 [Termitinemataceae bacterium]